AGPGQDRGLYTTHERPRYPDEPEVHDLSDQFGCDSNHEERGIDPVARRSQHRLEPVGGRGPGYRPDPDHVREPPAVLRHGRPALAVDGAAVQQALFAASGRWLPLDRPPALRVTQHASQG